jgi:Tol biopolymer transport system component
VLRRFDSSGRRTLSLAAENIVSPLAWSPDGRSFAFSQLRLTPDRAAVVGSIWRTSPDGGRQRLTMTRAAPHHVWDSDPDWSPDGRRIAFARDPTGTGTGSTVIHVVDARRPGGPRRLVAGGQPDWSPDGTRIAFVRAGAVFTVRSDGRDLRRVTPLRNAVSPDYSPDGRRIAFSSRGSIWVVDVDGDNPLRVAFGAARLATVDWG